MGATKPGHDESTSLMTISSPPVPGGDPSTGVRKRKTADHRTRPPPRPRRNGGIADPEGFEPSTAGLVVRCPILRLISPMGAFRNKLEGVIRFPKNSY